MEIEMTKFAQGVKAFKAGISENPYKANSYAAKEWAKGWELASRG